MPYFKVTTVPFSVIRQKLCPTAESTVCSNLPAANLV
jgi:hypothetical protein